MRYWERYLIQFDDPFLASWIRGNSKTYYYLELLNRYDIPILVHSNDYKERLIYECRERFNIKNPPIFAVTDIDSYYRQLREIKYRDRKFIIDNQLVYRQLRKYYFPVRIYNDEEIIDLVLTMLAEDSIIEILKSNKSNRNIRGKRANIKRWGYDYEFMCDEKILDEVLNKLQSK